jgi:hypothetical protein
MLAVLCLSAPPTFVRGDKIGVFVPQHLLASMDLHRAGVRPKVAGGASAARAQALIGASVSRSAIDAKATKR